MTAGMVRLDDADVFDRKDFDSLAAVASPTCVSIYLPTHRFGPRVAEAPLRLRNLLASAERELVALGGPKTSVERLLEPIRHVVTDQVFWRHQSDGLALFCSPDGLRTYRLAQPFPELAVVSPRFHLRPLLPLLSPDEPFLLLALSQNATRLYRLTSAGITPLDTGRMPTSIAEALAHEDPEKQLQVRTAGPAGSVQFYGHGGGGEDDKAALERYFRAIDRGLAELPIDAGTPLALACVSYYGPIYRSVSQRPGVVDVVVEGSPDELSPGDLHAKAWPLIEPLLADRSEALDADFPRHRAAGRTAEGVDHVDAAARDGRVAVLLLPSRAMCWGAPGGASGSVHDERAPGDVDRLDDIARQVLRTSGRVTVVEDDDLPTPGAPAAVLRYA